MIEIDVDLTELKDVSGGFNRGFRRYLEDGAQVGQNVALENVPEDKGELRRSLAQFVPTWKRGKVVWGSTAPHTLPQEYGTQPGHTPPLKPLLEWSERVTGDTGLGYYVALVKIPEEGLDANPYLRPGAEAQEEFYRRTDASEYISDELD